MFRPSPNPRTAFAEAHSTKELARTGSLATSGKAFGENCGDIAVWKCDAQMIVCKDGCREKNDER